MADISSELLSTSRDDLMAEARRMRAAGTGTPATYSPPVFLPLTPL
jgi:hypothetical protein